MKTDSKPKNEMSDFVGTEIASWNKKVLCIHNYNIFDVSISHADNRSHVLQNESG